MTGTGMTRAADAAFTRHCEALAIQFEPDIKPGANYDVAVEHDGEVWISGQVPRVQGQIAVTGALGATASASGFTQHSEVSDGASANLYDVFAANGAHTRTSVGVAALPKNAAVELDLVVAVSAA